jgi:hypothetical protein
MWDFQQAVHVFTELYKLGKVPPEAFIKWNLSRTYTVINNFAALEALSECRFVEIYMLWEYSVKMGLILV